jgi:hypothetical protein
MYVLSTLVMNHREHLIALTGQKPGVEAVMEPVRNYALSLPAEATAEQKAVHILRDLGYDGAHTARDDQQGVLTIVRQSAITPRRITYDPSASTLSIEKAAFKMPGFLERFHRRRGYQQDYMADDAWAVSVDLFWIATVFWCISGIWLWWEMRVTRRWGAISAAAGIVIFTIYLLSI